MELLCAVCLSKGRSNPEPVEPAITIIRGTAICSGHAKDAMHYPWTPVADVQLAAIAAIQHESKVTSWLPRT
ncbi:MAG: hypothetical protein JWN52_3591 [Actinomycetia bacterium]|nr:hypothetical protein [Actinomycetes bacterium]